MPEGDTIFRTAKALDQALAGRVLTRFEAPRLRYAPFAPGTVVDGAEAVGKHCLVRFDDGRVLHTHMQMTGSWHLYRPGERWRMKAAAMRALVEVPEWVAVCFAAPVVELTTRPPLDHLGPDLCRPDADLEEAVRRLATADRTIGEALLDQRNAAGIGNMWKAEACFACGIDPFTPAADVTDADHRRLLEAAAGFLRSSSAGERPPMQVYGRRDRPCRRCGTTISWAPQGEQRRGTYWCPACQPRTRGNAP
ncbi:MAG: nei [Actinomycetia bacterium]|nr:nei [Actinomycetes bacterium]